MWSWTFRVLRISHIYRSYQKWQFRGALQNNCSKNVLEILEKHPYQTSFSVKLKASDLELCWEWTLLRGFSWIFLFQNSFFKETLYDCSCHTFYVYSKLPEFTTSFSYQSQEYHIHYPFTSFLQCLLLKPLLKENTKTRGDKIFIITSCWDIDFALNSVPISLPSFI